MLAVSIGLASYLVAQSNKMTTIQEKQEQDFNSLAQKFEQVAYQQWKFRETVKAHFDIPRVGSRGATSQVIALPNK